MKVSLGMISHCITALLFLSSSSIAVYSQCPTGNVVLSNMDELNQFASDYPDCHRMDFNITVTGEDVWSLLPLAGLDTIMGNLELTSIGLVNNFSGLSNLTYINGDLRISNNPFLSNLSGFQGLVEIGGELRIINNPNISTVNGLTNLTECGGLIFTTLPALVHVNALALLDSVHGSLEMIGNTTLTNISALTGLSSPTGHVLIQNCPLVDLSLWSSWTVIGSYLQVSNISGFQSLGLSSLVTVNGDLILSNLPQLNDLSGLENLDLVSGSLKILSNSGLNDILALNQSVSYTDSVVIAFNPLLAICDASSVCEHAEGSSALRIEGNASGCLDIAELNLACTTNSLSESFTNNFTVFPNPFSESFTISSNATVLGWELYDLQGKRVSISKDSGMHSTDHSFIPNGSYLLRVLMEGSFHTQFLTKE